MATEKSFAVLAIAVVALSFAAGSGYFGAGTGAATVEQYDFSVRSVEFPAQISRWDDFTAKATFANTRPIGVTFVTYDYRIYDSQNREVFRVREGPSTVQLPIGVSTSDLEKTSLSKAGTYKVKVTIDYLNRFIETDETNNIYETTIKVV